MKTIFAFVFGAAVGAVVALLFAPKSGSELRHQIGEEAAHDRQRMQEGYAHAVAGTHDRIDKMHTDVQTLMKHQQEQGESVVTEEDVEVVVEESEEIEE